MKDPVKDEIRRILLGRVVLSEEGRLLSIPKGYYMPTPIGVGDGAFGVRILGIAGKTRQYQSQSKKNAILAGARTALEHTGRGLDLREKPEAVACLCRYVLTRPAVLVFSLEDGKPALTAWSGRGLSGRISRWRAIRQFEKHLPDTILPVTKAEEKSEKQKQKKGDKAHSKKEKKTHQSSSSGGEENGN